MQKNIGRNKLAENLVGRNKFFQKTEKHTLKIKNWPSVPYTAYLIHQYLLYYYWNPISTYAPDPSAIKLSTKKSYSLR